MYAFRFIGYWTKWQMPNGNGLTIHLCCSGRCDLYVNPWSLLGFIRWACILVLPLNTRSLGMFVPLFVWCSAVLECNAIIAINNHSWCAQCFKCWFLCSDCSTRLKSCEPEFLIATPERLLELVSLKAIDISCVSMLVSKCGYWKQKIDELHLIVLYLSF